MSFGEQKEIWVVLQTGEFLGETRVFDWGFRSGNLGVLWKEVNEMLEFRGG